MAASPKASDDDDRVVAKQGTLAAFNYFYGWPGVCFNKRYNHFGASVNDDVYFTTLGDNYVIDTLSGGSHISAYWDFLRHELLRPLDLPLAGGLPDDRDGGRARHRQRPELRLLRLVHGR